MLAHAVHSYCVAQGPSKESAQKYLERVASSLTEEKEPHACPGRRITDLAYAAGVCIEAQRMLMHAVVDHLRPADPCMYRISKRADVRHLFDAAKEMMRRGFPKKTTMFWLFYLHLISTAKAIGLGMSTVSKRVSRDSLTSVLILVRTKCQTAETRWDTCLPTGGIGYALELASDAAFQGVLEFTAALADLPYDAWRPHRLNSLLPTTLPVLGAPNYHRGRTLRFYSDLAVELSAAPVRWQRQDWDLIMRMLPGSRERAVQSGLETYDCAVAGCRYVTDMLAVLSPRSWPELTLSDLSCGLCLESRADEPHKDDKPETQKNREPKKALSPKRAVKREKTRKAVKAIKAK